MENLLKELKINRVISIDDSWEKSDTILEEEITEYCKQHSKEIRDEIEEYIFDKNIITLRELKESNEDFFNELYEDEVNGEDDLALGKLKEVFDEKLKVYSSIKEFEENVVSIEENEFLLFIIDINMGVNKEDSIIELLDVIENKYKKFAVVIYSHERTLIEKLNDLELRKEYLESKNKDIRYMALIHTMNKSEENLKNELMEKILHSSLYVGLHNFLETKKMLDSKIYNSIYNSELYNFEKSVLKTLEDGESIIDLMRKLFLIGHHFNFSEDQNFMEVRKTFIEISNCYKDRNQEVIIENNINENSKYSIIDYSINKSFKDIYTGDLFKINLPDKELYGVIINRSCDMIIRKSRTPDKTIGRSINGGKVMLLIFEEINLTKKKYNDVKNMEKRIGSGEYIFPFRFLDNGIITTLENKGKILYLDDFLLDFCTLNSEGKSSINLIKNSNKNLSYKSYYSNSYFKTFKIETKLNNSIKDALIKFKNINEENLEQKDKDFILNIQIEDLIKRNNNLNIIKIDNKLEIGLERIGRLQEDKTLAIYQNYLFNLSKRGVDTIL